jgi:hypothetical protein
VRIAIRRSRVAQLDQLRCAQPSAHRCPGRRHTAAIRSPQGWLRASPKPARGAVSADSARPEWEGERSAQACWRGFLQRHRRSPRTRGSGSSLPATCPSGTVSRGAPQRTGDAARHARCQYGETACGIRRPGRWRHLWSSEQLLFAGSHHLIVACCLQYQRVG